jgi:3-oxocholest-4-en-26-oyl-CoA dehydrogenase alpha subunit
VPFRDAVRRRDGICAIDGRERQMDFDVHYTQEQQAFRVEVRDWLEAHVPRVLRLAIEHGEPSESYQLRRRLGRELGARGWLYPTAPTEYGGGGLDVDAALVLIEEMARFELSLPPYYDSGGTIGSVAIRVWGTEEQRRALLPPIYRGDQRTWQLLTEPGAGSDLASASTQARRDGDDYVVTGAKVFIGSEHGADALWTIVRTGAADDRHHNLSWLMIDATTPGVTIEPMHLIGGEEKCAVYFDGARVPADRLVGGENNGWAVASTHLDLEHGLRSDTLIGARLQRVWNALLRVVPADDDAVLDRLADAYVRKEVVRILGMRNFWLAKTDQPRTYEGAQAYLVEKKTGQWFGQLLLDVLGPAALVEDGTRDRALVVGHQAGSLLAMHGGGTAEIQKLVMSRRIGIGKRSTEAAGRLA